MYDMIKQQMMQTIPFARHVGVEIDAVGDGTATCRVPLNDDTLNHIGTVHAGAMFTLGETASGAACAGAFAAQILNLKPVAASSTIDYLKKAKGGLTAVGRTEDDTDTLRAALKADGKVRFPVKVAFTDEAGEEVAVMRVDWHVSQRT